MGWDIQKYRKGKSENKNGWKKFRKNFFFSKNESCLKLLDLPRNHISTRGGGRGPTLVTARHDQNEAKSWLLFLRGLHMSPHVFMKRSAVTGGKTDRLFPRATNASCFGSCWGRNNMIKNDEWNLCNRWQCQDRFLCSLTFPRYFSDQCTFGARAIHLVRRHFLHAALFLGCALYSLHLSLYTFTLAWMRQCLQNAGKDAP